MAIVRLEIERKIRRREKTEHDLELDKAYRKRHANANIGTTLGTKGKKALNFNQ